MKHPLDGLRDALEAWRRDEATERVRNWQGSEDAASPRAVASRHKRMFREEYAEALARARESGDGGPHAAGLLFAHWARAAAESALADVRDELLHAASSTLIFEREPTTLIRLVQELTRASKSGAAVGELLERAADVRVPGVQRARTAADETAVLWLRDAPPRADVGPARSELLTEAEEVLAKTAELASDLVSRLAAFARLPVPRSWHEPFALVRAPQLDSFVPRRERFRRVGALFAPLGLEAHLAKHVRVVGAHDELDARTRIAAIDPPRDLRIAFSPLEFGVTSEMAAAESVARSLAFSLCDVNQPVESRRSLDATVARTFGALFAHLFASPVFWRKSRDVSRADASTLALVGAFIALFDLRLAASALVARNTDVRTVEEQREMASLRLSQVIPEMVVPPSIAALVALTPAALAARYRARRAAFAMHAGLRDRYDEDWFMNPRTTDLLRSFAAHGGATSIEAQMEEMEMPVVMMFGRIAELSDL